MSLLKKRSTYYPYVAGIILAAYTYFFYFILPQVSSLYDAILNITFLFFLLFIFISAYNFSGDFKSYVLEERTVLIILVLWFLITFFGYYFKGLFLDNPNYYSFLSRNFYYLMFMVLLVSFVNQQAVEKMMVSVYFIYFLYGVTLIPGLMEAEKLGELPVINKNVVGFFLIPFLAYLLIRLQHRKWWMIGWYVVGGILLYFTGARTSFAAYLLLPIFIGGVKLFKQNLRLFYTFYLLASFIFVYIIAFIIYPDHQEVNTLFTQRVVLWREYLSFMFETKSVLIGTGVTTLPDLLTQAGLRPTLHPHNQFVTMFVFNGVVGLFFFLAFILFSIPKKVSKILPSDAVIFSIITILFAEALIPLFDFFFLSFVFTINLLINRMLHKTSS